MAEDAYRRTSVGAHQVSLETHASLVSFFFHLSFHFDVLNINTNIADTNYEVFIILSLSLLILILFIIR